MQRGTSSTFAPLHLVYPLNAFGLFARSYRAAVDAKAVGARLLVTGRLVDRIWTVMRWSRTVGE